MTTYPLTGYGLMAKRHWTEFRPQMVKELEAQGKLEEALYEAQEATSEEMMELRSRLQKEQSLTPQARRRLATQATDQPDAWMQTERVFQANILANAAAILKPDQVPAFREALQQQIEATQLAHDLVPDTAPGATPALPIPGR